MYISGTGVRQPISSSDDLINTLKTPRSYEWLRQPATVTCVDKRTSDMGQVLRLCGAGYGLYVAELTARTNLDRSTTHVRVHGPGNDCAYRGASRRVGDTIVSGNDRFLTIYHEIARVAGLSRREARSGLGEVQASAERLLDEGIETHFDDARKAAVDEDVLPSPNTDPVAYVIDARPGDDAGIVVPREGVLAPRGVTYFSSGTPFAAHMSGGPNSPFSHAMRAHDAATAVLVGGAHNLPTIIVGGDINRPAAWQI